MTTDSGSVRFALNHMTAPRSSVAELIALARSLAIDGIEIRNDIGEGGIAMGAPPTAIRAAAEAARVRILSINALQRFDEWTSERESQAQHLADYAHACGAEAVVLCPVNDAAFHGDPGALPRALAGLQPILDRAGIRGYIEPLGFEECSLRSKRVVVEAIDMIGGAGTFAVLHDTFHHYLAGEPDQFPARTGLVHVSGVVDPTVPRNRMRDAHRVLVDDKDRLGNVMQMASLIAGGYEGYFSFEPFSRDVHSLGDLASALRSSMAAITAAVRPHVS